MQIAYTEGPVNDVYLSVFTKEGRVIKLLRCTKLEEFGEVVELRTLADPQYPHRKLILVYFAPRYVWGVLYRLNPKTFRPEKLLEAEHLETSQYLSHGRIW